MQQSPSPDTGVGARPVPERLPQLGRYMALNDMALMIACDCLCFVGSECRFERNCERCVS